MAVDFLPFANDAAANVVTQPAYLAAATGGYVQFGFTAGLAPSNQLNKVWRQSSVMTAALANMVASALTASVLDSGGAGSVTTLQSQLVSAIQVVAASALPPATPQGRLTLTTGTPALIADVVGATTVYYTAYTGTYVPVWNGAAFQNLTFAADLTLTLTAAAAANGIVDVFAFSNAGVLTLGFGPVWSVATPGSGARGSGAGTTALQRTGGLLTNANVITLLNGASTYANIPAGQATYLGSVWVNSVAGQTTCHVTYGQSRKWGVWNAYNRLQAQLQCGDGTASWTYNTTTWRPANNNTANSLSVFQGLAEEPIAAWLGQNIQVTTGAQSRIALGANSTTVPAGKIGYSFVGSATSGIFNAIADYTSPPALGINTYTALEYGTAGTSTYYGASSDMLATVAYGA
jgi:hypothetical protein